MVDPQSGVTGGGVLVPEWALPAGVHAFVTTRHGGVSTGERAAFNLAAHVGDAEAAVAHNRALLASSLERRCGVAPLRLQWLQQVHGNAVWDVVDTVSDVPPEADALHTRADGIVLSVLTADCLPVLYCAADGSEIAVAHAGWRGLCNGVLEATLARFACAPQAVKCWLGPAIGPCHFEVGDEVREAFLHRSRLRDRVATLAAFKPGARRGKWMGDLYALAQVRLRAAGVVDVEGDVQCTVCRHDEFYSYRHQPVTGRFATGILKVPAGAV